MYGYQYESQTRWKKKAGEGGRRWRCGETLAGAQEEVETAWRSRSCLSRQLVCGHVECKEESTTLKLLPLVPGGGPLPSLSQ